MCNLLLLHIGAAIFAWEIRSNVVFVINGEYTPVQYETTLPSHSMYANTIYSVHGPVSVLVGASK